MESASLDPARLSALHSRAQQQPDRGAPNLAGPRLAKPLVWLDLEMTGLNAASDTIIEIACLISDGSLEQVIEVRGSPNRFVWRSVLSPSGPATA